MGALNLWVLVDADGELVNPACSLKRDDREPIETPIPDDDEGEPVGEPTNGN
jgi:hypothetical protein